MFAYRINFATGAYQEVTLTVPLARGVSLPRNSAGGESLYDNGRMRLSFRAEPQARSLSVTWPNFGGQHLRAEVTLRLPSAHESMTIVIPIAGHRFYYHRKANCLPAEGWIDLGGERTELRPAESLGNMDWGRGVWEYDSFSGICAVQGAGGQDRLQIAILRSAPNLRALSRRGARRRWRGSAPGRPDRFCGRAPRAVVRGRDILLSPSPALRASLREEALPQI